MRMILLAALLTVAAISVTVGFALIAVSAGFIVGGLAGGGLAWLILGDVE